MTDHPVGEHCEAKKKQGDGTCTKPAGWGTDHVGFGNCKLHGGASPNGKIHAEKEAVAWRQRLADEMDPSVRVMAHIRDNAESENVRLSAASSIVDKGIKVEGDGDGDTTIIIVNMDDIA